jgi:hypothetical protein
MTRESRLLLVIGLLAVIGVTTLVLIANRYRRLVEAAPASAVARDSSGFGGNEDLRSAAAKDLVGRFVAIRAAVAGAAVEHRDVLLEAVDPRTGRLRADASAELAERHAVAVDAIRSRRAMALDRHAMAEADYDRLRRACLEWWSGMPVDPLLTVEFEHRRAQLEPLALGPMESLDEAAPSP